MNTMNDKDSIYVDGFEAAATSARDVRVGFSDRILLGVSVAGFCFLAVTIYSIVLMRVKSREEVEKDDELANTDYYERLAKADVSTLNRAQRRARAKAIMKQQRRAAVQPVPHRDGVEGDGEQLLEHEHNADNNENDDDDIMMEPAQAVGEENRQLSRKERQQAAKLAELKERRIFDEERRKQQQDAQEEVQREKRERLKQKAMQQEEQRRQQRLAKQNKEQQMNDEWLTFISAPNLKVSVEEWITELKENRVYNVHVVASAATSESGLLSSSIFDRIDELIMEARVSGIVEKRKGIFIYLTDDELSSIANGILKRGSVSLADIVGICEKIVE